MRSTCPTDGGYCSRISRSRSFVSCALRSSVAGAAPAAGAGAAGLAGAGACAAARVAGAAASSISVKTVILVVITLYIRRHAAEVNICPMSRYVAAGALVLFLLAPLAAQNRLDAGINAKIRQ